MHHHFYVASVPAHRLEYHAKLLVNAGYKVGIVNQIETAALKAVSENRNKPFERKLVKMMTKGTMVDEESGYLMCLVEDTNMIGCVAIQVSTGDVVYDMFTDNYFRSELETRLYHIDPVELLLPHQLSLQTEKLVQHSVRTRIERVDVMKDQQTSEFMAQYDINTSTLPPLVIKVLAMVLQYLEPFGLDTVIRLIHSFHPFITRNHMLLNVNTLINLEIYQNNTTHKQEGSLFHRLNYTRTSFGKRLLMKWIGRPLIDIQHLNDRVLAIEELMTLDKIQPMFRVFKRLPDLERGLCRIHYEQSSPAELVRVLDGFIQIGQTCQTNHWPRFKSHILQNIFDTLPNALTDAIQFKEMVDPDHLNDKIHLFKEDVWPEIRKEKNNIMFIEHTLNDHLDELVESTGIQLKYVSVGGMDYLLEVYKQCKVPVQWIKMSGTKQVSRYHNPFIINQLKERDRHHERLLLLTENAYKEYLRKIVEKYDVFREVVVSVSVLDCLHSLMVVSQLPNYTRPSYNDTLIQVKNARHPLIETNRACIPNDIYFNDTYRTMILTGPNMGGKSSYVKQIGLLCIMGQIGCYVPADDARLILLDGVYTRMQSRDHIMRGESTFMVEMNETSDIMKHATDRSLVILDELGRGTSTHDGEAIAYAALRYFIEHVQSINLFVTHYTSLTQLASLYPTHIRNYYMSYIEDQEEDIPTITFLYKLQQGVSMNSYAFNVARLAHIPYSIIKRAQSKAKEFTSTRQ
ncbi:muts domain V-domain-containing protein [Pilobolus umbonatus]|nr:muts domain V-domain-containing protein [Pilobolus umbonatus]